MAYRVYGRLICNGLNSSLELSKRYKIDIYEDENGGGTFSIPIPSSKGYYPLELLKNYFKIYLSKEELLKQFKDNLSITDEDIIEYKEYLDKNIICIKYKHDLIYLRLQGSIDGYKTTVSVEITSNNFARQKTFEIELFEEDINKFCDLLKLMQK